MTVDLTNDEHLRELLRDEVPEPGAAYWATIHESLTGVSPSAEAPSAQPIDLVTPSRIPAVTDNLRRTTGGLTALAVAAALLLIVGVLVGTRINRSDSTISTGFASDPTELAALPGPRQNVDHWHAVYGVWDCTLDDGTGDWVPAFESTRDDTGIHSHGDGMIYIHPFFEHSAGRNATFSHFVREMDLQLTDTSLLLDDGRTLVEGTICNGERAVLHLRRWQSDAIARNESVSSHRTITDNLNGERFYNDREIWVLALAPLDADLPLPPADRFAELDKWPVRE